MPTATVMPFALKPAAKGPLRFTAAQRQAVLAIGYVPGLAASIEADDDGDEYAAFLPADDENGLDSAGVMVSRRGFSVLGGGLKDLGTFASIHDAIEVARRDITTRMAAYDPEADVAAWRELFASLG